MIKSGFLFANLFTFYVNTKGRRRIKWWWFQAQAKSTRIVTRGILYSLTARIWCTRSLGVSEWSICTIIIPASSFCIFCIGWKWLIGRLKIVTVNPINLLQYNLLGIYYMSYTCAEFGSKNLARFSFCFSDIVECFKGTRSCIFVVYKRFTSLDKLAF